MSGEAEKVSAEVLVTKILDAIAKTADGKAELAPVSADYEVINWSIRPSLGVTKVQVRAKCGCVVDYEVSNNKLVGLDTLELDCCMEDACCFDWGPSMHAAAAWLEKPRA